MPKQILCPCCNNRTAKKHLTKTRKLKGAKISPQICATYKCDNCGFFTYPLREFSSTQHDDEVIKYAIELLAEHLCLRVVSKKIKEKYKIRVPLNTIHDWKISYF
jgi:transcriptional/translational regulatory protein YebC/TACO1